MFDSIQNVVHDWQRILRVTRPTRMVAWQIDLQLQEDIGIGAGARSHPAPETLGSAPTRAMIWIKGPEKISDLSGCCRRAFARNPNIASLDVAAFDRSPSDHMGALFAIRLTGMSGEGMVERFAVYVLRVIGQVVPDGRRQIAVDAIRHVVKWPAPAGMM